MRTSVLGLILFFSCALRAQAPEPAPLAHGNMPGEPHHHLKIENEYVRAYYVEVPPHDQTQLHQHDHDYIFVSVGPADVVNAVLNKPETHLVLKDGETHFTRGGFAHVARNLSDAPFRNITIELLKPQGEPQNLCAQIVASAPLGPCDKSPTSATDGPGFSVEPQLTTSNAKLDLVRLGPESESAKVGLPAEFLIVALADSEIQVYLDGKPGKTLHGGEFAWLDPGSHAAVANRSKKPAAYLQLSFKETHSANR